MGTARASCLLLVCKSKKFDVSFKFTQFSKKRRLDAYPVPKKGVPEEVKIGRTYTIFDFLKYVLGARPAIPRTTRNLDFDPVILT